MAFTAPTVTNENPHEMVFRWYLEELQQYDYIEKFDRELETFAVLPTQYFQREKHLIVKENPLEEFALFQDVTYTYDFRIIWTQKAINIFTEIIEPNGFFRFGMPTFVSHNIMVDGVSKIVSYVDVKPHYAAAKFGGGKMGSYYTFPFIQKFLYHTKGLYVNKIIPIHSGKYGKTTCLFATTFVPNRYKYTDKNGKFRTIPYRQRSIISYATQKADVINRILSDNAKKELKNTQTKLL